ncbi:MAG: acyl-CoA thioesterase [Phycisphaerales bacterium]|nr:acyl-CoA thioesterase [Phycisphaerales bacterium]
MTPAPSKPSSPLPPAAKPPSTQPAIRVVMMPRDTNPQGTIFGGVILSLIDQAAFIEALRQAGHRYVTVAMQAVEFHKPVLVGDVLSLWATTTRVGRTSISVHVEARSFRPMADSEIRVTAADVVLVAVDDQGNPVEVFPVSPATR